MFRQGDILIVPLDDGWYGWGRCLPLRDGRYVLAEGEATGHAHTIAASACDLAEVDEERPGTHAYFRLVAPAAVEHPEHAPIELEPGCYMVVRQREYRGWEDGADTVLD